MSNQSHVNDYSRYFILRQKVYLVNMSADRNSEVYESLSGVVTLTGVSTVEIKVSHGGRSASDDEVGKTTYKLTSEALGSGIQVLADLTGIVSGNIFQFRMHGTMEMFQRRVVPRVVFSTPIYHLRGSSSLAHFKKEWKRAMELMGNETALAGLPLQEAEINLSAGGVRLAVDPHNRPTPLSMIFIRLDEGMPVCALTETIWEQRVDDGLYCGLRFIHILKADQVRINDFISNSIRKSGGTHIDYKRNWVLVDKMVADDRKQE